MEEDDEDRDGHSDIMEKKAEEVFKEPSANMEDELEEDLGSSQNLNNNVPYNPLD